MKKDNRKIRMIESIWEEVGVDISQEVYKGYVLGLLEQLHLGLRDCVCFTINIFGKEGLNLAIKYCKAFNCRIAAIVDGDELWVVKKENTIMFDNIPSRLSDKEEVHRFRGRVLGYSEEIIDSYFIK